MKVNKNYLNVGRDVDSFRYSSGLDKYPFIKNVFNYVGNLLDKYIFNKLGVNELVEYVNPRYAYAIENEPAGWEYRSDLLKKALGRS